MKIRDQIRGVVRVEICGAMPQALLNACASRPLPLWDLEMPDACTLHASVQESQLPLLENLAARCMCEVRELYRRGGSRNRAFLKRRVGLLAALVLVTAAFCASSLFLWEIDVQGCERLTEGQVLRELADCGVGVGSFWPGLNADLLRSRMLTQMPELAWMTVNVSGSRALVLMEERLEKLLIVGEQPPADLVAGRPVIIRQMAVRAGRCLVSPGQAVTEGETLVSARVESMTAPPREVYAQGKILADTWYEQTAVRPCQVQRKERASGTKNRFALKIGRNRINFYPFGQKMLDGYDKIVHEYRLGAEGLFALPVSLIREELRPYTLYSARENAGDMGTRLQNRLQETIDGDVVFTSVREAKTDSLLAVTLRAQCYENIARIHTPD